MIQTQEISGKNPLPAAFVFVDTEIGRIGMAEEDSVLTHLFFQREKSPVGGIERWTPLLRRTADEIGEYLLGKRRSFDIPLRLIGTEFQRLVWEALRTIPYGETRTYREIAEQIGHPKAYRAVGMANHRNPVAVIVPCHRVIGADGSLTGFGGGLPVKQKLLDLEQRGLNTF
ncbi:MAG: methylated-DNA--[protein]-cysteine S-methyltransferase [Planctomycetaceae bacterium]|jgi:methylated-DNA-[protein]-cysteine S-methyltransferase|nr:methylated-DNA--[protein]-cysteine S-methyltransferase [Planctomycetaceae bacterium]